MLVVEPYAKIVKYMGTDGLDTLRFIEETGKISRRLEGAITDVSWEPFVDKWVMGNRHTALLRFSCVVVDILTDRGVTHEIVRHGKTQDYLQESTRYCAYNAERFDGHIRVLRPHFKSKMDLVHSDRCWAAAIGAAEREYFNLLANGEPPEVARDVLPTCTASLIRIIANFQGWRHFLLTRTTTQCHPKMLDVTVPLLTLFQAEFPKVFADIEPHGKHIENMMKVR